MRRLQRERDMVKGENYGALLTEIAKVLQRKYTHMSEISRLTEEMAEELSDRKSVV